MAVRYERRFGWGSNRVPDSDVISGMARASVGIVPRSVFIEGGVMAARMGAENNGSTIAGQDFGDSALFSRSFLSSLFWSSASSLYLYSGTGPRLLLPFAPLVLIAAAAIFARRRRQQ